MTCDTSVSDYFLSYRQGRIILSQLVNFLVELRQNGYSLQLRDLDLSYLDLRGCNLSGASFRNCNFAYTDFRGCQLNRSIFRDCNLTGANFQKCVLSDAHIYGCTLNQANLRGSDLFGVRLSYGELSGSILSGAHLAYAQLDYADLSGAYLVAAKFYSANLTGANFSRAKAWGADFASAILNGAQFIGADFGKHVCTYDKDSGYYEDYYTDPNGIRYSYPGANFSYAYLVGATFQNTRLVDCIFNYANLKNVLMVNVDLSKSYLKWTVWENSVLRKINLAYADLHGANLIAAKLCDVSWRDANLVNVRFSGNISGFKYLFSSNPSFETFWASLLKNIKLLKDKTFYNLPKLIIDTSKSFFCPQEINQLEIKYGSETTAALLFAWLQSLGELGIIPEWNILFRELSTVVEGDIDPSENSISIWKIYKNLSTCFSNITDTEKRLLARIL